MIPYIFHFRKIFCDHHISSSSSSSSSRSWRFRHVSCSLIFKMKLVPPSLLRSSYVPFGLHCSAFFGILFVSILCKCCSPFFWYCFISCTMFCAPVFSLIHWFFLFPILLFPVSLVKISSVLLLNVVPLFSSVPKLHFQFSILAVILWILNLKHKNKKHTILWQEKYKMPSTQLVVLMEHYFPCYFI